MNLATRSLGKAVTLNSRNQREWYDSHPQTCARIEGVTIPGLSQGLDAILAAMRCFPEATCVGWDLLMTDGGYSILEANAPQGIEVCQVHTPLLSDPRTARFFRSHGIQGPNPSRIHAVENAAKTPAENTGAQGKARVELVAVGPPRRVGEVFSPVACVPVPIPVSTHPSALT